MVYVLHSRGLTTTAALLLTSLHRKLVSISITMCFRRLHYRSPVLEGLSGDSGPAFHSDLPGGRRQCRPVHEPLRSNRGGLSAEGPRNRTLARIVRPVQRRLFLVLCRCVVTIGAF